MRSTFDARYLLIEGRNLYAGRLPRHGVRGALLAVAASDIRIVWSVSSRDTAEWLHAIALRAIHRSTPPRGRRLSACTPASLLALVPGVSPATAAELVDRFGSVAAIAQAEDKDLLTVRGLGPVRVATLKRVLA